MERFKVGQKVKLKNYEKHIDHRNHMNQIGVVDVVEYDGYSSFDFRVKWNDGSGSWVKHDNATLLVGRKGFNEMDASKVIECVNLMDKLGYNVDRKMELVEESWEDNSSFFESAEDFFKYMEEDTPTSDLIEIMIEMVNDGTSFIQYVKNHWGDNIIYNEDDGSLYWVN